MRPPTQTRQGQGIRGGIELATWGSEAEEARRLAWRCARTTGKLRLLRVYGESICKDQMRSAGYISRPPERTLNSNSFSVHPGMFKPPRVYRSAFALALLAALASVATAAKSQMTVVACTATAYVNDPDLKGTNVRRSADAKSAIAATITDSDSELEITGSQGDWLRVRESALD